MLRMEVTMKKLNLKGVNAETVTGVLILALALVNACLKMFGIEMLPIENQEVSDIISAVFLIGSALYNTWKNRNLTSASQAAQNITDAIKQGELLVDDVEKIVQKFKDKNKEA